MKRKKSSGFAYYLGREILGEYKEKSPELRLKWLYMGNLLRMACPARIIKSHNRFRETQA